MADDDSTTTETDEATERDADETQTEAQKPTIEASEADEAKVKPDDDWRIKSRKNETRAKKAERELAEANARLADIEKANLSEQEKAIAKAREEAAAEVTTKYEDQQRSDRIENAVTKLSLKGFKAKDKDGNEVTLRFADPDDAQLRLERALRNEDLTYDDIYADGKVNAEAVTSFLTELLEEHPRLRAEENGGGKKDPPPNFDGGKGTGGGGTKDLDEMSPEEHYKAIHGKT